MAKFCTQCGSEIRDGIAFCTNCGAKAEQNIPSPQVMPEMRPSARPAPRRTDPPTAPHAPASQPKAEIPADKTVSTGTFFGLMFLFSLPILGWLICLIMAFASKNKNIVAFRFLASFITKSECQCLLKPSP